MKSFRIALFTLILSSCQLNSYHIDGFAREACEGDTVCMCQDTSLQGAISVTVVENGKFTFVGDTDTMAVYRIFLKKAPEHSVTFFLEAGRTTVELSPLAAGNRVSGTIINNEWQQLNDSIRLLGREIVRVSSFMFPRTENPSSADISARPRPAAELPSGNRPSTGWPP